MKKTYEIARTTSFLIEILGVLASTTKFATTYMVDKHVPDEKK